MQPSVPIWLRDYNTTFSDIQVHLEPREPMAKGLLGTLTTTAHHPCYKDTQLTYEIRAIEYTDDIFDASRFNRRIILGNVCTEDVLIGFQANTLCTNNTCPWKSVSLYGRVYHSPTRTMWCMNCWSDDMYETGMGGVATPPFILYQSTNADSFVRNLRTCNRCHSNFVVASDQPRPLHHTTLFLPIQTKALERAVEDALNTAGIVGTIRRARHLDDRMSTDQKQEIIASALRPDRIERIAENTGINSWDVLDNM